MKAVRPFFARAAKKCKYSYEGEVHQTSAGKQFGRKSTEINDAMEAMSSASLVDMQVPEVSSAGNLNQHETPIKNNSANSTYCTPVYPSTTTIKPVQSSQDEEQNASSGSYQEYCSESMEPLQQPCFTSPDKLGRRWHNLRRKCYRPQRNQNFTFKVVSYNVLADGLLHSNSHLYCGSEEWLKDWEYRRKNLLKELLSYKADVLCLQEVEDSHYEDWFEPKLREKGYTGVYKKRSGDKTDGCATFFKKSRFTLVKSELVSFNKPNVKLMDRHNVAVVVLLKPKVPGRSSRNSNNLVCISNTHLLFNKKRGDIKLAQLACLFSEIEEIARISSSGQGNPAYHPIICCGDFNSTPFSPIYDFVMRGSLNYKGMHRDNFSGQSHVRRSYPPSQELRSNIIPWELGITTTCTKRNESTEVESVLSIDCEKVDLQPSGVEPLSTGSASCVSASKSVLPFEKSRQHFSLSRQAGNCAHLPRNHHLGSLWFNPEPGSSTELQSDVRGRISLQNTQPSSLNSTENENVSREEAQSSTHLLAKMTEKSVYDATTIQRHNFSDVFSVYRHYFQDGQPEVTTFHDQVCTTVDYIFVSPGRRQNCQRCHRRHGSLQMTGNLELLSESDIETLGGLPNKYISSDHLALVSSFLLHV